MAPDVLVLRNATDSTTRTHIGIISDPDTDDPDTLVKQAYENSTLDTIMPGRYELYEVGASCETSFDASHLEAPEYA